MNPSNLPPPAPLSPESFVRRRAGVVLRTVAGEHMLVPTVTREVDLDSLFLLNPTGVFIWNHLEMLQCPSDLAKALAREFSIPVAVALGDVRRFLSSLIERNLAERMETRGN